MPREETKNGNFGQDQTQVQNAWHCASQCFQKYKQSGDIGDLNMAIFWDQKSASLASDQDPNKV
jgi:hypothetical protein